jgi:hypothetical protein
LSGKRATATNKIKKNEEDKQWTHMKKINNGLTYLRDSVKRPTSTGEGESKSTMKKPNYKEGLRKPS